MPCPRGCCDTAAEHYRSIAVAPRSREVGSGYQREEAMTYDLAAYKALRAQGYQPPRIDGSYDLTRRATSEAEIRLGSVISDRDASKRRKGARLLESMLEINDHAMTGKAVKKGGKKKMPMKARR